MLPLGAKLNIGYFNFAFIANHLLYYELAYSLSMMNNNL